MKCFLVLAIVLLGNARSLSINSKINSKTSVIDTPRIEHTLYVDDINGSDSNDGLSEDMALKTLQEAKKHLLSGTQVLVKDGTYRNEGFGSGSNDNKAVLNVREMSDLLLTNFPGHSPVIEFDGAGGISMGDVSRVEISGFEIGGPNRDITKEEALEDRLLHSNRFIGRAIAIWGGNHINIHNVTAHHCPNSGIRVDQGDYVALTDNRVYNNTWWGSSAESAIVIPTPATSTRWTSPRCSSSATRSTAIRTSSRSTTSAATIPPARTIPAPSPTTAPRSRRGSSTAP